MLLLAGLVMASASACSHGREEDASGRRPEIAMFDHLNPAVLRAPLDAYVRERMGEFALIEPARRRELDQLSAWIEGRRAEGRAIRLVFICTHNSRRSHFMQVWAQVAAAVAGLDGVQTASGGTEATAFNPRAVAALERAGLRIEVEREATSYGGDVAGNPRYLVTFDESTPPTVAFSKIYTEAPNPTADFAAVMACSQADGACPVVEGAVARFAIPYVDPKVSDGTPREAATYDERCAQIAREMLHVFARIRP